VPHFNPDFCSTIKWRDCYSKKFLVFINKTAGAFVVKSKSQKKSPKVAQKKKKKEVC